MNAVITGISRGIGFNLASTILNEGHEVYGVARTPTKELIQLKKKYKYLHLIELDLSDDEAQSKLRNALDECPAVDLLINNAGVYEEGNSKQEFMKTFEINTYTPFMVTETLLPKLRKSQGPKLIHISSLMGSISDNTSGGSYAYRSSKSALNMIHRCFSVENDWLLTCVMHPGWVQTRMGGNSAPVLPEDSARGIWKVINELTKKETGTFRNYLGKELPW